MADFWQRLAARSLGETPTIQPAIEPLYAPGKFLTQPLDQTEESQDIDSLDDQPTTLASQRVNLPPTSPFVELTRLNLSATARSLQLAENQFLENSTQPAKKIERVEQEQTQIKHSIEPLETEREQPAHQRIDLVSQVHPIAPALSVLEPIAPNQTNLPTRSSSLVPVFRSANLVSQTNSLTDIQISTSLVQPIAESVATKRSADDRPSESRSATQPSDIPSPQSRQNSQPQPIEQAIVQPVLSIAPLIQVAQPQANQPQANQPQPDPLPTIAPLSRRTEAAEPIAEPAERRSSSAAAIPTIQVTIGRIEVRATSPAVNRPKPSRSTPQLSLQDYLKQQDLRHPGGTR